MCNADGADSALLGSVGNSSDGDVTHSSPLNEIFLGNVDPSLKVNFSSLCGKISACTYFREGWTFSRKISFNDDECVMFYRINFQRL